VGLGTLARRKLFTARMLVSVGAVRPARPDRAVRAGIALARLGPTPAGGYTVSAARHPDDPAIIDEFGTLTFREVHRRTNALAHELRAAGLQAGDKVAIVCRNHRGFVESMIAGSKLGADLLYLNTALAAPQVAEVVDREKPAAIFHDAEFDDVVVPAAGDRLRIVATPQPPGADGGAPTLDDLIARGDPSDLKPPGRRGRVILLTSGTTGAPKGAQRHQPKSLDPAAVLFDRIPLRARENTLIAAPLFHTWGLAHFTLGMAISSTLVLRLRFEPEDTLETIARERCTALIAVPVMLQRMVELPEEAFARHDLSCLRIIAVSGSALPGDLATRVMDRFGDVLYNLYGSTEAAWATIASPRDLRAAPGTAGRPPRETVVRLLDEHDREVAPGQTGRIFVGNEMVMECYTTGDGKPMVAGLMSTGDLGRMDAEGRLFVAGRDDEMIISGGENVFPREVEDVLAAHPAVCEVAVIGVDDAEFGQRLIAFVVAESGHDPTVDDLLGHVKANLARFQVPREIVFMDEMPRNATGKILKRELSRA
jgi:acyl-CoA synthetase (AMP-forming)/AMP-acid ligase II